MKQRGRKSIASLSLVHIDVMRKPIEPPASLQRQAKVIFHEIVASVDPKHFRRCDVPLVASLAMATHMVKFYSSLIGEEDHPTAFRAWSDAVKLQISLSTKLRLTPQSRYDARAANREAEPQQDASPPWEFSSSS
jgi:phage terminase small subunit